MGIPIPENIVVGADAVFLKNLDELFFAAGPKMYGGTDNAGGKNLGFDRGGSG